jgi:hypothetical protein
VSVVLTAVLVGVVLVVIIELLARSAPKSWEETQREWRPQYAGLYRQPSTGDI